MGQRDKDLSETFPRYWYSRRLGIFFLAQSRADELDHLDIGKDAWARIPEFRPAPYPKSFKNQLTEEIRRVACRLERDELGEEWTEYSSERQPGSRFPMSMYRNFDGQPLGVTVGNEADEKEFIARGWIDGDAFFNRPENADKESRHLSFAEKRTYLLVTPPVKEHAKHA